MKIGDVVAFGDGHGNLTLNADYALQLGLLKIKDPEKFTELVEKIKINQAYYSTLLVQPKSQEIMPTKYSCH